nr:hypothetical protein [Melittangium boletus]
MTWGVLAAAVGGLAACSELPQQAGNSTYHKGFTRGPDMPLYNGTIVDNPTSIDPRTPDKQGTANRSLLMDAGERALRERQGTLGYGGSGPAPTPGMTPYKSLGAEGSVIAPSSELPAAQSVPGSRPEPANTQPRDELKK